MNEFDELLKELGFNVGININSHPHRETTTPNNSTPHNKTVDSFFIFLLKKTIEHDIKIMERELKIMKKIVEEIENGNFIAVMKKLKR